MGSSAFIQRAFRSSIAEPISLPQISSVTKVTDGSEVRPKCNFMRNRVRSASLPKQNRRPRAAGETLTASRLPTLVRRIVPPLQRRTVVITLAVAGVVAGVRGPAQTGLVRIFLIDHFVLVLDRRQPRLDFVKLRRGHDVLRLRREESCESLPAISRSGPESAGAYQRLSTASPASSSP